MIFGRNNLVTDAPISRLDLLICRNTLMYFTAETQGRILRHFHFALRDHGVLMLGKSEMMISHRDVFEAVDINRRVFRKRDRAASLQSRVNAVADGDSIELPLSEDERASRDSALEIGPHAAGDRVSRGAAHVRQPAGPDAVRHRARRPRPPVPGPRALLPAVRPAHAGRRGAARAAPRSASGRSAFRPPQRRGADVRRDRRAAAPQRRQAPHGVAIIVFEDVSRYSRLQQELEGNRRDLELAYEELQSTIDELETTNEELQSANEELQTTNEELQSTNEELETMNEELQSTNEELETINDELRDRTAELNQVNEFLEAILTSLGIGVAVVDRQQRVQVWNHRAEDLWGVRQDEAVAHHLLSLDIGLPTEQLAGPLRSVLGGASDREHAILQAVNRRGRAIDVRDDDPAAGAAERRRRDRSAARSC